MSKEMDAVRDALAMSMDDLRLVKRQAEDAFPDIGYLGLIDDPDFYGHECNDFSEFAVCYLWLRRCEPWPTFRSETSYYLKHVVEADGGRYVTNGAFIQAAAARGFRYRQASPKSPNAVFAMRVPRITDGKTWPLLQTQPIVPPRNPKLVPFPKHPERALITPSVRARILERDGFRCRRCGNGPADARLVVDHITPIASGGKSTDGNLQTLCEPCNVGKGARPPHPHDFLS